MNDYISRSDVLDWINFWIRVYDEKSSPVHCKVAREMKDEILKMEKADVAPITHGKWVRVHGYVTPGGDPVWACSECGKGTHVYGIEHGSYGSDIADRQWVSCPNCGAMMKEALD